MKYLITVSVICLFGALANAAEGPLFIKVVGNLGLPGEHTHPSTNCQIGLDSIAMMTHYISDEGYHSTDTRSKQMEWEGLEEIQAQIAESAKEELEKSELKAELSPSVLYLAVHRTKVKTKVRDKEVEFDAAKQVILYKADKELSARKGAATKAIIDWIDERCPNDKPFAALTRGVQE